MMWHLLKIDLKKLTGYRTFWVICGLYFFILSMTTASGMELLKWLARTGVQYGADINIAKIPLYHFPDVWQNLTYISGFFKTILGFMVVISITNEFSYRTVRQNIIDGLSRQQFIISKILTNLVLSGAGTVMVLLIGFVTGLVYSPVIDAANIFSDLGFFLGYLLEVFAYFSFALLLGIMIQRSGLTIVILILSPLIEFIIKANIDDYVPWLIPFFPLESINNLIPIPFSRYVFQEIQNHVSVRTVAIVTCWIVIFNYLTYYKLKKSDI